MTTTDKATASVPAQASGKDTGLVEMAWDPITRIVGSLGIYTKIDFKAKTVAECHSTSSIFRGYSIFMKGKDPRDAHFITSRICGICIACTMPGFPDKFMPFMDEPPGARVSSTASGMYGTVIRSLRGITARTVDKEPKWRVKGPDLRTGYQKTW